MLPARLVLLGHPVAHSLSPRIQNAALRAAGIPLEYVLMDVPPAQLRAALRTLRAEGAAGNVTIPHKQAVFSLCDHRTNVAERAGAVNTF
ncbi:MAG: shikimate dehydrogenase, partial [Gemmatimonadales bacterium]